MDTTEKKMSTSKHIEGPAGKLFIDDGGQGGIPVLMIHSFGGNVGHWKEQLTHLRPGRRAIAFDLRGHGQSDAPSNNDYHVQSLSNDIAAVADSLDLDRFILVGHSMGGSAAIDYAIRFPERVAGLMLVGTPGKSSSEASKPVISSLESEKYQEVMDGYMKQLLTRSRPEVNSEVMTGINKISKTASISIIKAVFAFDPLPALSGYPGPKLIVAAEGEPQPNSLSKQLPEIPDTVINGTSHWIQMDNPSAFNKVLDDFIMKVEKALKQTSGK